MSAEIRRIITIVEETRIEGGREVVPPTRRAASIAIIRNPFAGSFTDDLSALSEIGEQLGALLPARAIAALGIAGDEVESFGKAAIVGQDGDLEHAAAILHPTLGAPFRELLGGGPALIPSAKKRGAIGSAIDVPLGHKEDAKVRSHFDAMEVRVADAPRADEILVAVAITDSGRPHARVGGLTQDEVTATRKFG